MWGQSEKTASREVGSWSYADMVHFFFSLEYEVSYKCLYPIVMMSLIHMPILSLGLCGLLSV